MKSLSTYKKILLVSLCFFFTLLFTGCPKAEEYATIEGKITDAKTGNPIAGANVKLDKNNASSTSNSDGSYLFTNLLPNSYTISVTKNGYIANPQSISITGSETKNIDFQMETPSILVFPSTYSAQAPAGTTNLTVTSNTTWVAVSSEPTWLTCTSSGNANGVIVVNYVANNSSNSRTGTITVTATGLTPQIFTLSQAALAPTLATITGGTASAITDNSASVSASIDNFGIGSASLVGYGFCYSSSNQTPTIDDTKKELGTNSNIGNFTTQITNLSSKTKYYIRAFATNTVGTGYSSVFSFTTLVTPILPILTINTPSSIAETSADVIGNLTDIGSSAITQRGHCWSTNQNPTITDNKTSLGATSTIGNFTSQMANLLPNTTYYIRTYATNNEGTGYSNQISFTTIPTPTAPTVTTNSASNILQSTANIAGNITNTGTASVTQHGHCWSTNQNPTTADSKSSLGTNTGTAFASSLTGLSPNTTYYVRAYAINSVGTSYSSQITFTTLTAPPTLPAVTTNAATSISMQTAVVVGSVTNTGNTTVTQRGHCWSINHNPTTSDSKTSLGSTTTTSDFTSNLTGLNTSTTYYIRAYATNSIGTSYSDEISITTDILHVTNGLVAYYNFDDGKATDFLGNFNGVVNGATSSTDIPNSFGNSMNFSSASSQYISIPYNFYSSNEYTFTYNVWIKTSTGGGIIGANLQFPACLVIKSNNIWFLDNGNSNYSFSTDLSSILMDNNWHMLTVLYNNDVKNLYIDAQLIETRSMPAISASNNATMMYIGKTYPSTYFNGKLDNVRIYNTVLTGAQVTEIYNAKQ